MGLFGLFRRKPHERAGFALYTAAVGAARQPGFFAGMGVPDTLDGRFDLICVHTGLMVRRLRRDADPRAKALAQAVFDAMFSDMDQNLREMGVSDLAVGKRVRNMWEAFHGRAAAYEAALDAGEPEALAAALARNVWRGAAPPGGAEALAAHVLAAAALLGAEPFERLAAGESRFPTLPEADPAPAAEVAPRPVPASGAQPALPGAPTAALPGPPTAALPGPPSAALPGGSPAA